MYINFSTQKFNIRGGCGLKKIIMIFGLSVTMLVGILGYNSSTSFAGKVYPLESHSFELTQMDNNGKQVHQLVIDKEGHFYKEIKSGTEAGNFELWDGKNFYRYNKEYKDLMIVKSPDENGKVVAHPFLSEVVNEEISKDLNQGKLKKAFLKPEYSKKSKSKDGLDVVEEIEFDKNINHPKKYVLEKNGKQESFIEISNVKKQNQLIVAEDFMDINKFKEQGVNITEIDPFKEK